MTPRQEMLLWLLTEIGIIAHLVATRIDRTLPAGLNEAQFGVLNHFARLGKEAETPSRLARAFQVTKGNMTNTVQRLEALGYVTVEPDPSDGRGKLVRPTPAGLAARDEAVAMLAPAVDALLADIGTGDIAAAHPVIGKLRQALDNAADR
jgi:DNA-binding MarR family transcriptional regulator